jgi:hypothetical protein
MQGARHPGMMKKKMLDCPEKFPFHSLAGLRETWPKTQEVKRETLKFAQPVHCDSQAPDVASRMKTV